MLFDIDLEEMIQEKKMIVRGINNEILDYDFLKKYDMIQSASLDIRLNTIFAVRKNEYDFFEMCKKGSHYNYIPVSDIPIDPFNVDADDYEIIELNMGEEFIIPPLSFCLAGTIESVELPHNICYQLDGKSTIGRLALSTHITAGFADPGFKNQITCELFNHNRSPIILRPGMYIGQYKFFKSSSGRNAKNPYCINGTYAGQPATQYPKTKKIFRYLFNEGFLK